MSDEIFQSNSSSGSSLQSTASLARAGRASKIGARAGRIVRIMRLIRLVKLYKHAQQALLEKEKKKAQLEAEKSEYREAHANSDYQRRGSITNFNLQSMEIKGVHHHHGHSKVPMDPNKSMLNNSNFGNNTMIQNLEEDDFNSAQELESPGLHKSEFKMIEDNEEPPQLQETNLGKKLSDLTTKRVITIVLAVIISIPLLQQTTYVERTSIEEGFLNDINLWGDKPCSPIFDLTVNTVIEKFSGSSTPLVFLEFQHSNITSACPSILYEHPSTKLGDLRLIERNIFVLTDKLVSIYDNREQTVIGAWLSIGRTIFICVVLTTAALMFSNDANNLVLAPIESMVEKVKRIAKNPLEAAQIEENEAFAKELVEKEKERNQLKEFDKGKLTKEQRKKRKDEMKAKKQEEKDETNYETQILERTIIKIGALLAIGFGEAGSEIIAKNMEKSKSESNKRWGCRSIDSREENAGHLRILRYSKFHRCH